VPRAERLAENDVGVMLSSHLQSALAGSTGTVTAFLEQLAGEPIDADVRRQLTLEAASSNDLEVDPGETLLVRAAVLKGRRSGCPYVYAESTIALGRIPESVRARLESSSDPIGRILTEQGIAVTRGPVSVSRPDSMSFWREVAVADGDDPLVRTYRLSVDGRPAMVITECFLPSLDEIAPGQ